MTDAEGTRGYRLEVYRDEDGSWVAEVPELPGCVAASTDPHELLALAGDSIAAWVEAAVDDGRTVPAPATADEYSGRFVLRVPKGLHRRLAAQARREGVSLNTLCATALAADVGAAEASGGATGAGAGSASGAARAVTLATAGPRAGSAQP
ncbi:MAG TPA: type II toxin-antitoxin system HicB family antitoxin [Patescibacteria group bacterium]|nr:type II toxin-antitoxin system HicB family antitoxin [Patescibacteria group bacterium]